MDSGTISAIEVDGYTSSQATADLRTHGLTAGRPAAAGMEVELTQAFTDGMAALEKGAEDTFAALDELESSFIGQLDEIKNVIHHTISA
jgi:hypothetical protein